MKLNEIADRPGARKTRIRVGIGVGSGKGKTGGRGVKGQKSRRGVAINGFEGGQMPIYMRLPKRGFTKPNAETFTWINLGKLQGFIDAGKIDPSRAVDEDAMVAAGLVRRAKDGVRLLAKGVLTSKVELVVSGASRAAVAAVESAGGRVTVTRERAAEAAE